LTNINEYKVKIYGGESFIGYAADRNGHLEFNTQDEAQRHVDFVRANSSNSIWCRIEKQY